MSTALQRPREADAGPERNGAPAQDGPSGGGHRPAGDAARNDDPLARRSGLLTLAVVALLLAAGLPLARVFIGWDFVRPVLSAGLLALALPWTTRRLGAGPLAALLVSAAGWVVFVSVAFFPDTLRLGVLPTRETLADGWDLWLHGIDLVRVRPAPTYAEPGLMLLTLTGVWAVSHTVEGLVFDARSPVKAVLMAMVLWTVPLALSPHFAAWIWAVPLLVAASLLLLAFAGADVGRWGRRVDLAQRSGRRWRLGSRAQSTTSPSAWLMATAAITAGVLLSGVVPGFDERPWLQAQGLGGATLTTNPIVNIRSRLVTEDAGPVMRVTTSRPVYLRTTSLDVYSVTEEWTNEGISGRAVGQRLPFEVDIAAAEQVQVDVSVVDLPDAVLLPAPYQAAAFEGALADQLRYDPDLSTLTLESGVSLQPGDEYSVVAAIPDPTGEELDAADTGPAPAALTALPDNVPAAVEELAREIVDAAGATSPFQQALAIQQELRSWEYSLEPPQGHSGRAMEAFLDRRVGYCEQYAGTMAVMLRTLGVPARVAVGYSPGELLSSTEDGDEYLITNANAHAWVEVLFPGYGWIAFEPTPREDGNVLVPSAANLAPSMTAQEERLRALLEDFTVSDLGDDWLAMEEEMMAPGGAGVALPDTDARTGDDDAGQWPLALTAAAATALALLVVGLLLGRRRRARRPQRPDDPPHERVLRARRRVDHLGRGLGLHPSPSQTDREHLQRLGGEASATRTLAERSAEARYAPQLDEQAAVEAEQAAERLCQELTAGLSRPRRTLTRARGQASGMWAEFVAARARPARDGATTTAVPAAHARSAGASRRPRAVRR